MFIADLMHLLHGKLRGAPRSLAADTCFNVAGTGPATNQPAEFQLKGALLAVVGSFHGEHGTVDASLTSERLRDDSKEGVEMCSATSCGGHGIKGGLNACGRGLPPADGLDSCLGDSKHITQMQLLMQLAGVVMRLTKSWLSTWTDALLSYHRAVFYLCSVVPGLDALIARLCAVQVDS